MGIPGFTEIEAAVGAAIADFQGGDQHLLEFDLNERTISHRFAVHLQQRFPGWDVDCEYHGQRLPDRGFLPMGKAHGQSQDD